MVYTVLLLLYLRSTVEKKVRGPEAVHHALYGAADVTTVTADVTAVTADECRYIR
jgi:hypothetical protein